MFLLALTAFLLLALGPATFAAATGSKAAVRAADREGMPERAQTNHPAHTWEARVTSDASSPAARPAVSPDLAESDDLETRNHKNSPSATGFSPSASPGLTRGLALGVSCNWAGQPLPLCESRSYGLDLSSCTASPRPRIMCGEADRRRVKRTTQLALL